MTRPARLVPVAAPAIDGLILDFDGTLCVDRAFYAGVYARAIEEAVVAACGAPGRRMLRWHRARTGHAGILALGFFGVPFADFAARLEDCPIDSLPRRPALAELLRALPCPAVLYSGSPAGFVARVLRHWGIDPGVFREIVGWQPGDGIPVKHGWSPEPFRAIADRHGWAPARCWSVGDSWESDLRPARAAGMRTIGVGPAPHPDHPWCETIEDALARIIASAAR